MRPHWDVLGWYATAAGKMVLAPETRARVEELLADV
jgi:DNA-binding IclR family transcriptional regulator